MEQIQKYETDKESRPSAGERPKIMCIILGIITACLLLSMAGAVACCIVEYREYRESHQNRRIR